MSGRKINTVFGAALVVLVISMIGVAFYVSRPVGYPLLDPLPPSDTPPDTYEALEPVQVGSLMLNSTANVTGMIPHVGPMTFNMILEINITNVGTEDITDFRAVKMSVYSTANSLFYTFDFQYDWNATISAGDTVILNYRNRETRIEHPFEPFDMYARVLVNFANQEAILTTPLLFGDLAIE